MKSLLKYYLYNWEVDKDELCWNKFFWKREKLNIYLRDFLAKAVIFLSWTADDLLWTNFFLFWVPKER